MLEQWQCAACGLKLPLPAPIVYPIHCSCRYVQRSAIVDPQDVARHHRHATDRAQAVAAEYCEPCQHYAAPVCRLQCKRIKTLPVVEAITSGYRCPVMRWTTV